MSDDTLGSLVVEYKADLTGLQAGSARAKAELRSVDDAARGSSGGFSMLKFMAANALMDVGQKAIEAGVSTLKMAGDFNSGITTLVTGAGESQKNIGLVTEGILNLAPAVGETTQQLEAGMFMIESSGQHGAQALLTLKDAAEGAKVGMAPLKDVANGVTTEMTDYASSNLTAAQATNDLIATVARGKTHMQDLSASLAQILPTASAAHVGLSDVSGAMATMTGEGVPAANAATYLRQTIIGLEAPGSKAVKTLADIGLSSKTVATEMQTSLPGALQLITDHLKTKFPEGSAAYVAALKDIAGGSKNMQGILDLTGAHLQTLKDNVLGIADAVKKGGDSISGWALVQQQFNEKLDQGKEVVETLGIKLGEKLIPYAEKGLDLFTKLAPALEDTSGPLAELAGDVEHFGQNVVDTVQKSGAFQSILQLIHDTLPGVEQFVGNVGDALANKLLPPTLSLVKNFSTWLDKSNILTDGLHALGDEVETVATILAPFIQDLSNVFNWLSQNKPATDALVSAVEILGGAFIALKVYDQIVGFQNMFTKLSTGEGIVSDLANVFRVKLGGAVSDFVGSQAPNLKGAFSDIGGKAKAAGQDVASIGANAETSAAEVSAAATVEEGDLTAVDTKVKAVNADLIATGPAAAEGGAAAKLGLAGLVGTLGTIAGYATLLALPFFMVPNNKQAFNPDKQDQYPAPGGFWDLIKNMGISTKQTQDFTDIVAQGFKKDTQQAKDFADSIDKAWQDMEHLGGYAESHNRILGNMLDPMVITTADVKVQELKAHADDLAKPPYELKILTPQVVAARQKVIDLKSHIDDLKGPESIGVLTPQVITARQKVIDLKSHIDDLHTPVALSIGTRSVDGAILKVMELKSHLDDIGGTSVAPSVSIATGAPFRGHASGGFSPIGEPFLFNEQGPELGMAVPGGVQIWSHAESMHMLGGGGSGEVHVHVTNIIDGQAWSDQMGGHLIKTLYKTGPVKSGV